MTTQWDEGFLEEWAKETDENLRRRIYPSRLSVALRKEESVDLTVMTEKKLTFNSESYDESIAGIKLLIEAHWEEVTHYPDIPLAPDYERYKELAESGHLRIFTLRKDQELCGYAVFFITPHIHYKETLIAAQDILFLDKKVRGGSGFKFINWCDQQLKKEGINIVTQHIKAKHNFGKMLERMDYELMDLIYTRRLN